MSSSPTTSETKSSPTSSSRGSGFSMKSMILALVFGVFASSTSAAMMPMGMGMDPMMGMPGMGMPPMGMAMGMPGMGMPGMGMAGDPMMMRSMGYHYRRGRRRGILGLRRGRGRWVRNRYGYGMPGMMGMPGMGMPGMGMGMPGMGMPPIGMAMGIPGMGMPGMGMPGVGMPVMGMPGVGMPLMAGPMAGF